MKRQVYLNILVLIPPRGGPSSKFCNSDHSFKKCHDVYALNFRLIKNNSKS